MTQSSIWFVTGSQHLYGERVLQQVANNSQTLVAGLNDSGSICTLIQNKGTVTQRQDITRLCQEANLDPNCLGVMFWMHTFSPAKMWLEGLAALSKPWMHLHTQFNAELPWQDIDMAYMNLHQSAHGCREFGFAATRLGLERTVVAGHWQDRNVQARIDTWARAALGVNEARQLKVARFGDNMRQVAVTEGNKVSAQIQFGYEVHGYGIAELAEYCQAVSDEDISRQLDAYATEYDIAFTLHKDEHKTNMLLNEARLELGMQRFLEDHDCNAFTNTFENLAGISNLPGLATQRLMAKGYGYGGEGDWKTSALVRMLKRMSQGKSGGTSFMEDYTYHLGQPAQVLGAHMLEVCPSITRDKPVLDVHPHTIGCKADIARLKFSATPGPALNATLVDLGHRFRLVINQLDTVTPPASLPNLPVAHALWEPQPSLAVSAEAWILAGAAHHSAYTQAVDVDTLTAWADMAGIETCVIDNATQLHSFKQQLRNNAVYYSQNQAVR